MVIDRPNQVWCADITDIPMRRGFLYLVAVMDWSTRKVLSWRVSNTMDVELASKRWKKPWHGFDPDGHLVEKSFVRQL
jgi:transposase InsO family protein